MARNVLPVGRSSPKRPVTGFVLALLLPASGAFAWGERGHHVLCEVATRLVQEEGLKKILLGRSHMMGHLCNIPDIYWRNLRKVPAEANASHFLSPELLHRSAKDLPLKFSEFLALAKKENVDSPVKAGSLWWRADQFFRLSVADGKKAAISFRNADIFDLIVDMGLMGHFVGDGSMPYHSVDDFDGWEKGRGGIHSYYESLLIDDYPLDLPMSVFRQAQKQPRSSQPFSEDFAVQRMKDLSVISIGDLSKLEALDDKIILHGSLKSPDGNRRKNKPTERKPAFQAVGVFGDLPVAELARGAALVAELWDRVYVQSGRPDLSGYKSFRYPLAPRFVPPDYLRKGR